MNSLLCLEKFPALAWKLFMRTGLALTSGLGLPRRWGTQETCLVLRGAWGSPKAGIKPALCCSLQRLLGLPGTQTPLSASPGLPWANTGVPRAPGCVLTSPGVIGTCSRSPALAPAVIGGFPVPPIACAWHRQPLRGVLPALPLSAPARL